MSTRWLLAGEVIIDPNTPVVVPTTDVQNLDFSPITLAVLFTFFLLLATIFEIIFAGLEALFQRRGTRIALTAMQRLLREVAIISGVAFFLTLFAETDLFFSMVRSWSKIEHDDLFALMHLLHIIIFVVILTWVIVVLLLFLRIPGTFKMWQEWENMTFNQAEEAHLALNSDRIWWRPIETQRYHYHLIRQRFTTDNFLVSPFNFALYLNESLKLQSLAFCNLSPAVWVIFLLFACISAIRHKVGGGFGPWGETVLFVCIGWGIFLLSMAHAMSLHLAYIKAVEASEGGTGIEGAMNSKGNHHVRVSWLLYMGSPIGNQVLTQLCIVSFAAYISMLFIEYWDRVLYRNEAIFINLLLTGLAPCVAALLLTPWIYTASIPNLAILAAIGDNANAAMIAAVQKRSASAPAEKPEGAWPPTEDEQHLG